MVQNLRSIGRWLSGGRMCVCLLACHSCPRSNLEFERRSVGAAKFRHVGSDCACKQVCLARSSGAWRVVLSLFQCSSPCSFRYAQRPLSAQLGCSVPRWCSFSWARMSSSPIWFRGWRGFGGVCQAPTSYGGGRFNSASVCMVSSCSRCVCVDAIVRGLDL